MESVFRKNKFGVASEGARFSEFSRAVYKFFDVSSISAFGSNKVIVFVIEHTGIGAESVEIIHKYYIFFFQRSGCIQIGKQHVVNLKVGIRFIGFVTVFSLKAGDFGCKLRSELFIFLLVVIVFRIG